MRPIAAYLQERCDIVEQLLNSAKHKLIELELSEGMQHNPEIFNMDVPPTHRTIDGDLVTSIAVNKELASAEDYELCGQLSSIGQQFEFYVA